MRLLGVLLLPDLPLQLAGREAPEISHRPCALVTDERHPRVLFRNERAAALGVAPGDLVSEAVRRCPGLCLQTWLPGRLARFQKELGRVLHDFSPRVELAADPPWEAVLEAQGLDRLWPSLSAWASDFLQNLERRGLSARMALGRDRFLLLAWCLATDRSLTLFTTLEEERKRCEHLPLKRLGLAHPLLDRLAIRTLGELARLPAARTAKRFGPELLAWQLRARKSLDAPPEQGIRDKADPERPVVHLDLPGAAADTSWLLFQLKTQLHRLVPRFGEQAVLSLELVLKQAAGWSQRHRILPAEPTRDVHLLIDLLRLRLEALRLEEAPDELELHLDLVPRAPEQLELFPGEGVRRRIQEAQRALAALRAEFGSEVVFQARLDSGHLPEEKAGWQPHERLVRPRPGPGRPGLVRRLLDEPVPIPEPRNVERRLGPYLVSGRWWNGEPDRVYSFLELRDGRILWVFRRRGENRLFLCGWVE